MTITFNNIKEMAPYYNKELNIYTFGVYDNGAIYYNAKFNFDLETDADICAGDIIGNKIKANNICAKNITCKSLISTGNIYAHDIIVDSIMVYNNIESYSIKAIEIMCFNTASAHTIACDNIQCRIINAIDVHSRYIGVAKTIKVKSLMCDKIKHLKRNTAQQSTLKVLLHC